MAAGPADAGDVGVSRGLVDGNKRPALAATIALSGLNGYRLTLTNDEAYTLGMEVASGHVDDVARSNTVDRRAGASRGSATASSASSTATIRFPSSRCSATHCSFDGATQ